MNCTKTSLNQHKQIRIRYLQTTGPKYRKIQAYLPEKLQMKSCKRASCDSL